jgi:hypothetical protein
MLQISLKLPESCMSLTAESISSSGTMLSPNDKIAVKEAR